MTDKHAFPNGSPFSGTGLTKRERNFIAINAMAAMLSSGKAFMAKSLATISFEYADAMIAESERAGE
jgi:hypothetical protein